MRRSKSAARAPCRCAARCRRIFEEGAGALDPEAIATVAAEAWPAMRDADELHEALLGLGVLPVAEGECGVDCSPNWQRIGARPLRSPLDGRDVLGCRRAARSGALRAIPTRSIDPPTSSRRRPRARFPKRRSAARRRFCAAGSNARAAARLGTGARSRHAARSGGSRPRRNSKPKGRFCAAGSRVATRTPRSNGATAACWRAFTA